MKKLVGVAWLVMMLGVLGGLAGAEIQTIEEGPFSKVTHWEREGLKGKVAQVEETTLSIGEVPWKKVMEFHPNGMYKKQTQYRDGTMTYSTTFDEEERIREGESELGLTHWVYEGSQVEIFLGTKVIATGTISSDGKVENWQHVNFEDFVVKRNAEGWLSEIRRDDEIFSFDYNKKGQIIRRAEKEQEDDAWEWGILFTYDDQDQLLEERALKTGEVTIRYDYEAFDDQGNWTERKVIYTDEERVQEETRTITYFD